MLPTIPYLQMARHQRKTDTKSRRLRYTHVYTFPTFNCVHLEPFFARYTSTLTNISKTKDHNSYQQQLIGQTTPIIPSTTKMVNLTSTLTAIIGLAALASAVPTLEKRAVTCRDDLGSGSFGRVSQVKNQTKQASKQRVKQEPGND
jgi:hypothetical protein